MSKIDLQPIQSLTNEQSFLDSINNNSAEIEAKSDRFISRDGTSPNTMLSDLDMNSHRILNVSEPTSATDVVRYEDLVNFVFTLADAEGVDLAGVIRSDVAQSLTIPQKNQAIENIGLEATVDSSGNVTWTGEHLWNFTDVSLTQPIKVSLIGVSGTPVAPSTFAGWPANEITVYDTGVDTTAFASGIRTVPALSVGYIGGGGTNALGVGLQSNINIVGTPATDDEFTNQWVGVHSVSQISVNCGGTDVTIGDSSGSCFGFGGGAVVSGSATNIFAVTGGEINVEINTGCSAYAFGLLDLAIGSGHDVKAAEWNFGLNISSTGTASGKLDHGILFSDYTGDFAFDADSVLIGGKEKFGTMPELKSGIDFSMFTFSDYYLKFELFNVAGDGLMVSNNHTVYTAAGAVYTNYNPNEAAQQAKITFSQTGTTKWEFGKAADDTLFLFDSAGAASIMTCATASPPVFPRGINTKQSVADVNDTTPTAAELTAAFGSPATLGRGFVATIDDADGDTNGYLVFTSDASWYFLKFTKAT